MLDNCHKKYRDCEETLKKLEKQKEDHLDKLTRYQAEVDRWEAELEVRHRPPLHSRRLLSRDRLQENIEQASVMCARPAVEKKKTADKLKQEIATIGKALKEREKRSGMSIEQIDAELIRRRDTATKAIDVCKEIAALIGVHFCSERGEKYPPGSSPSSP